MTITKEEILKNIDEVKNYIQEIESEKKVKEKKKINITIKNRFTGSIIWESEKTTYKEAVEEAVNSEANLSEANLGGADLSNADLSNANLGGADLSNANLGGANLSEADLSNADLSEANLGEADLSNADLSNADLSNANLSKADLNGTLYYMGAGNRNFEALCKAIKTIRHNNGKFKDLIK